MAGYFPNTVTKRLTILGDKEILYIEQEMDEVSQRRSFEFLTGEDTPAIVIAMGMNVRLSWRKLRFVRIFRFLKRR